MPRATSSRSTRTSRSPPPPSPAARSKAATARLVPPSPPSKAASTPTTNNKITNNTNITVTPFSLLPLMGFTFLLGVVAVDVIMDATSQAEWKRGYYAAHRTAAFPYNAFIILVILLGFGSFIYSSFLSPIISFFFLQDKTKETHTLPPQFSDWRILLSACLGVLTFLLFVVKLVPQQDFIAQVVTANKSMLRNATLMEEALAVIKEGHLVIAAVLVVLMGLQVSLLTYPGVDKCGSKEGDSASDGGKKRRQ